VLEVSERTHAMKNNFMALHQQGYYIAEIAAKYNLSPATVYRHLQEIADENGVSRESLLQVIRTPTERQIQDGERRMRENAEELKKDFKEVSTAIDKLLNKIDQTIKEEI